MTGAPSSRPFLRIGPAVPTRPVILSVPHAGRDYSESLLAMARVGRAALETLEDRYVDRLVWRAADAGFTILIATAPRAEIDINRDPREIDPALIVPAPPAAALVASSRSRGGLGVIPSRLAGHGVLWRGRIAQDELNRRLSAIHGPYHDALDLLLRAARARFGTALLLDCHSMPPRDLDGGEAAIVFGDRHGSSAAPEYMQTALSAAHEAGFRAAANHPYAGGHVAARHGRPGRQVHALQMEVDRALYLGADLREPGPGFDQTARLILAVAERLAARAEEMPALAAE